MMNLEKAVHRIGELEEEVKRLRMVVEDLCEAMHQHTHTVAVGGYDGHGNGLDVCETSRSDTEVDPNPVLPEQDEPVSDDVSSLRIIRYDPLNNTSDVVMAVGDVNNPVDSLRYLNPAKRRLDEVRAIDPSGAYHVQVRSLSKDWHLLESELFKKR